VGVGFHRSDCFELPHMAHTGMAPRRKASYGVMLRVGIG
jgi:hypothetical protein